MSKRIVDHAKALSKIPFVRGVATFQVGGIVMAGIGFLSSVIYARLLGVSAFGLYAIIGAFVALISIVTSYGQETAAATFLAEAKGRKDMKEAAVVLRYFFQSNAVSLVVYALLFAVAPLIAAWTGQPPLTGEYARVLLINAFLQEPNVLLFMALQLQHRIALITIIENTIDILQVVLSSVLLFWGWQLWGIVIGTTAVTLLATPVLLWLYDKSAREQGLPTIGGIIKNMWVFDTAEHFKQGLWIALDANIGKNIYPNLFYMVLGATTSLQTVGVFRIGFKLATLPITVIMPSITRMTTFAIPRIAAADPKNLIASCKKVIIGAVGIGAAASLGATIVAPPLIPIVYGNAYTMAIPVFLALLPINVISATQAISIPLLRVYRRVWFISVTNCIGVALGVGVYFLSHLFLPTLAAISAGILVFQINTLTLFPYLFRLLRRRKVA